MGLPPKCVRGEFSVGPGKGNVGPMAAGSMGVGVDEWAVLAID